MQQSDRRKVGSDKPSRTGKDRAVEIANVFEWLITAFILAFIFRAFIMEAFRIPTGSMADTLKGAHYRLRCRQCGHRYNYGFIPERHGLPQDTIPSGPVGLTPTRCPSCGYEQQVGGTMPIANGDRILVLKCIYQFVEPKRWDVIVFKNPLKPKINYIKRLVALPEEILEIIDGDVYINGNIQRKPPKVQRELLMPVYNNDFQPVRPKEHLFDDHVWQPPLRNVSGSNWTIPQDRPVLFCLDVPADQINSMTYDASGDNDFRAAYAYDDVKEYDDMPYCSDLMVRFYAKSDTRKGCIGISLSKYRINYKAWVDMTGRMFIAKVEDDRQTILCDKQIEPPPVEKTALLRFANVDHLLEFQFADHKLTCDLGRSPDDAGVRDSDIRPQAKVFGSGRLTLSHVAVFRDIHYTRYKFGPGTRTGRATEGDAFPLAKDEFFVLGDNSPNSEDCRWWDERGKANEGRTYRAGIVPRDYLVGKALFVYWPSGFRLFGFAFIPNVGQMRFIYGGADSHR